MKQYINFLAVLPSGFEYFEDVLCSYCAQERIDAGKKVASNAIKKARVFASRLNPHLLAVDIYILKIKEGVIIRTEHMTTYIQPPIAKMTKNEFDQEIKTILQVLPTEFHQYVHNQAWSIVGDAEFEEALETAKFIINDLKPVVDTYTSNITDIA